MRTPNRLMPGTPQDDILAYINQNFDVIDDQDETKIIKNGDLPTVLSGRHIGGFNGADYGFKVAKPGYDVTTATDDQLIFSSAFNTFKIVTTGTMTLSVPSVYVAGNTVQSTFNHNLGYTPGVLGYVTDGANYFQTPAIAPLWSGGVLSFAYLIDLSVDSSNLYASFTGSSAVWGGTSYVIRYYLLRETAN